MSLLPNLTQSAPGVPLYGGGGGGSVGNTLTLSTLTFGIGVDSNQDNIVTQTGVLQIAGLGDDNNIQIGGFGSDGIQGNQYGMLFQGSNGAQGDITFGDILGNGSGLVALNYQSVGLASSNVSTLIYGNASVELLDGGTKGGLLKCFDLTVSSINGATPAGGINPNPQFSTLTCAGTATFRNGLNMSNTFLQFSQFSQNSATAYYNAGNSNLYVTSPSTAVVAIGTQSNPANLQVGDTSVNIPTALYATSQGVNFSSLTVSSINGNAPALTSYSQQDVGALFSTLFAANPGLSTIAY